MAGLDDTVIAVTAIVELTFLVFFVRHLSFAVSAMRTAPADLRSPVTDTGYTPFVSVLVPCKNEEQVLRGLMRSLLRLDYPTRRLQLILVDDASTDRTPQMLDDSAARTPHLTVLHREKRAGGGKSGALNAALRRATGEIIVIFDADHEPRPDVLRRLVRHFEDPSVGAVQGRCEIRNASDSMLTRLISIDYKAGYLVNEYGRQSLFKMPAYGGANCAVRATSLRAVGGWNEGSVTEDTDLTLRLVLRGERVRYDVTSVDTEEGAVTLDRFWLQRYRWARGHQQVWRDYRRAVWSSRHLSLWEKLETTLFLLAFHLPVISALGLLVVMLWASGISHPIAPLNMVVFWTLLFLGPLLELGGGLLVGRSSRRDALALAFFLPIFFVSIAVCSKAWFDGLIGSEYAWVKTARAGDPTAAPAPRTPAPPGPEEAEVVRT